MTVTKFAHVRARDAVAQSTIAACTQMPNDRSSISALRLAHASVVGGESAPIEECARAMSAFLYYRHSV